MRRRRFGNRWPGAIRKQRCDYCPDPARHWLWYRTHVAYAGPYRAHGELPMNVAACDAHLHSLGWRWYANRYPTARVDHAAAAH